MQYLISVLDDVSNPGPPSDMAAIGAFNERLRAEGHWVFANGPQSGVARGVRQGHRTGGQHRRDRLPDAPPRPAGVVAFPLSSAVGRRYREDISQLAHP